MYFRLRKSRVRIFPLLTITGIALVASLLWDFSGYSVCHQESSRCACHKCLTDSDPWFNGLINEAPKPFLSRKYKLSEDDFNWWKHLQGAKHQNFTLYNETVDKVFQIITPITDVAEPNPDHCRSCAVVGNSGNLKGSHYGDLIDFHDIVIRINYGRTKGYETDVGTKTTHRIMYPESATKLDNTTHLVFFPFKTHDFLWLYKCLNPGESNFPHSNKIVNKDLIMILHPAFIKYVHEVWLGNKGYYPSTGFLTVVLSLLMCDEVTVFGFGADSEGNWSHYFDILRNKQLKTGAHPGKYEYGMIERLYKKKKITFFKGCSPKSLQSVDKKLITILTDTSKNMYSTSQKCHMNGIGRQTTQRGTLNLDCYDFSTDFPDASKVSDLLFTRHIFQNTKIATRQRREFKGD